ncbi:hypothetical protein Mal15_38450 [Stieleria maiorica]|uniref:Planctomycete cytochrome C n=1 Tax=Stieleria maiorica TaxID=2795974 RepID=A0A5B9MF84_9BACT|nr:DUF1592 domain-containing protein [Stieleria maiorica]QEF99778.1 hypothetical protein Mal15_38450 [Stieleria maiorica]
MANRFSLLPVRNRTVSVCCSGLLVWFVALFCENIRADETATTPKDATGESLEHAAAPALELFLTEYCLDCHSEDAPEADLDLSLLPDHSLESHDEIWERVLGELMSRRMPPPDAYRPSEQDYQKASNRLVQALAAVAAKHPKPGRTDTFRRLNRFEYQNAIRDLLALDVDAEAMLPADESSHGFDNVTVADLPPTLVSRYINAARTISRLAIAQPSDQLEGHTYRMPADVTQEQHVVGLPPGTRGGMLIHHTFPRSGVYEVQVHLARDRNEHVEGLNGKYQMEFLLDRDRVADFELVPPKAKSRYFFDDSRLKARIDVTAGPHDFGVTFVKNKSSLIETKRQPLNVHFNSHRHPRQTPAVFQVSITGPYVDADTSAATQTAPDTPSRRRVFTCYPSTSAQNESCAEQILSRLARLAYRRAVDHTDIAPLMEFYRDGEAAGGFEAGIERALASLLVSPRFLFRIERDPEGLDAGEVYPISDIELASRLSFFLWSSLPDDELLTVVEQGKLRDPEILRQQMLRMLSDRRAEALVTNFANQWLHLRNLESKTPDARLYPDFDDNLRQAMRRETELLFQSVVDEDRSVLDLLRADYTYLNERLAKHYGIPHVYGSRFRRVNLSSDDHRGGLLRHGSILTVTSYATRTSPVIRGNWVLENLLATPTPPPPPNVPSLEEEVIGADLPIRQRLAKHRSNAACASCHVIIDPIGFSLENYDAVGRWRDTEFGVPVDAEGALPSGDSFHGVTGLEAAVLQRPELFATAMTEKLITYALGRGVTTSDGPAIREIVRRAGQDQYRFSALIWEIINSPAFQMRTFR